MQDKITLVLTKKEANSLEEFIQRHNEPCRDCDKDKDCGVAERGICIAKNMDGILLKVRAAKHINDLRE